MDLLRPGKIVLHPLGGAFSAKPHEARDSGVARIPRKKLVVQGKNSLGSDGGRGAGKESKRGEELTNRKGHFLWVCGCTGVQNCCRRLLPVFPADSAVADDYLADSAATGNVVSVVLVLNVFQAGDARGRIGQLKLSILERLRQNRRGKRECGRKSQDGDPAHGTSSGDREQALAI